MRIALAQLNPTIGDLAANSEALLEAIEKARADGADVLLTPEMAMIGYPPRDLLLRRGVVEQCEDAVRAIAAETRDLALVIGHPRRCGSGVRGVRNSASVCVDGGVAAVCDKRLLPGYDIFDEDRYFDAGAEPCSVEVAGERLGVLICEDLWRAGDVNADPRYSVEPVRDLADAGCRTILCLNASPFIVGKFQRHLDLARQCARTHRVTIVVVNQVGGQDDLVFDGRSFVIDAGGALRMVLPAWESAVETFDTDAPPPAIVDAGPFDAIDDVFRALVLGLRDYCRKLGRERVLIGLSGGIDSAVTAAIAAAAVGPENVHGVMMPSRYSSAGSRRDAGALAERLGIRACDDVPIETAHAALETLLESALDGGVGGLTDENLQARLRGLILMAYSNASDALVLATGNKSELAVGYTTLYGDMCGAVSVLGDVTKTRVYALARHLNEHAARYGFPRPPIPDESISKPPSAELRPDQTDQDTLPPYEILDEIIARCVEHEEGSAAIVEATGFDAALVESVMQMIDRAEFKRHQAAVILKVTQRAFGRGRPMPIVMRTTGAGERLEA